MRLLIKLKQLSINKFIRLVHEINYARIFLLRNFGKKEIYFILLNFLKKIHIFLLTKN